MSTNRRRRSKSLVIAAVLALAACTEEERATDESTRASTSASAAPSRLIMVALDAFHPDYLKLDARGRPGGGPGNWLTPNLRSYFATATWYPAARDHLPSATDMNHLNAVAGTSSGQTGVLMVGHQFWRWDTDGKPIVKEINVGDFRDDLGRPLDTLFHAWKRRWPGSRTSYISGKDWVAEGYRGTGAVDLIVTATSHPDYVQAPRAESFFDPVGDSDARCDPESARQKALAQVVQTKPERTPADSWTVDAALAVYAHEPPDMAYILLAQTDDGGHLLGAASDPAEYAASGSYEPPPLCVDQPDYHYVSTRQDVVLREPVLDNLRAVDRAFGRLLDGLQRLKALDGATVVVLSDHAMTTHLAGKQLDPRATDYRGLLKDKGLITDDNMLALSATSVGALYFKPEVKQNVAAAKQVLAAQRAWNPETQRLESPWWVLDRADAKNGVPGVVGPGELYHTYFIETDGEKTLVWPNLVLFAKSGFQIPAYGGDLANLGVSLPVDNNTALSVFVGGHGSVDTQPILMGFRVPGKAGKVLSREVRISDIAPTVRSLFQLDAPRSTCIGHDLSVDF